MNVPNVVNTIKKQYWRVNLIKIKVCQNNTNSLDALHRNLNLKMICKLSNLVKFIMFLQSE